MSNSQLSQKEIHPRTGLGQLKFGFTRDQVQAIMGEPDEVDQHEDGEGNSAEAWHYDELELSVSFEEEFDWKLVTIAVSSPDYTLNGKKVIGLNRLELIQVLNKMGITELLQEDWSSVDNPDHHLVMAEEDWVNFWLDDGVLTEIQWSPHFNDEEEVEWPA
jgi:hypothetical protein